MHTLWNTQALLSSVQRVRGDTTNQSKRAFEGELNPGVADLTALATLPTYGKQYA
ncbi:hypothetical protein LN650_00050 [Klebsiella pneumoniae subsp. pneumoniae]|nr:hypothetical protein [Klebsiella pneumoniae subsp. pneumoniae]